MNVRAPHYLLFSGSADQTEPGRWRFVLRTPDGSKEIAAEDVEPELRGERLELLATVRGLEALDQPSRVTLVTPSRYVRGGIRFGLKEWRRNGWRWEYFGQMVPVKNGDLWQRVDRAMRFHELECRNHRIDPPHGPVSAAPKAEGHAATERRHSGATAGVPSSAKEIVGWAPPTTTPGISVGGARSTARRGRPGESVTKSWHAALGLGRLLSLVKLIHKNRPVGFRPAAVCREA